MNDVEDLLVRTLRDPGRALPAPADPVTAIRRRVRRQRRAAALAAAGVVGAAAAVAVPAAVQDRDPAPAPVATDRPADPGLLPWAARGPLVGDTALVGEAAAAWRGVPADGPAGAVRLVWAGRIDDARAVVLQSTGADGRPLLAEVGDRAGALSVLRVEELHDPTAAVLRLVDPGPGRSGTTLLVRPGGASVVTLAGDGRTDPVAPSGLRSDERDLTGAPVAVLDADGALLGDATVPPAASFGGPGDPVRLVPPIELSPEPRAPLPGDYADGARLAARLPGTGPVRMAVVETSGTELAPGRVAVPRFYELEQDGHRYTATELLVNGRSACLRVTPGGVGDALVLRCRVPSAGVIAIALHRGIRLAGVRVGSLDATFPDPSGDGWVYDTGPDFPTGPLEARLVDDARTTRPPIVLPPYQP